LQSNGNPFYSFIAFICISTRGEAREAREQEETNPFVGDTPYPFSLTSYARHTRNDTRGIDLARIATASSATRFSVAAKLEVASKKTCSGTSIAGVSGTRMLLIASLLSTGLTNLLHIQHDVKGII